jgi:hypothetical protein
MRMTQGGRVVLVEEWGLGTKIYGAKAWRQDPCHVSATTLGA